FSPESFETYDDQTLKIAINFLPQLIKQLKGNIFSLFFKFMPEIRMVLSGGVPKLILIAEFTGDDEAEVHQRAVDVQKVMTTTFSLKTHVASTPAEAQKYWII